MKKLTKKLENSFLFLLGGCLLYIAACNSEAHIYPFETKEKVATSAEMVLDADRLTGTWIQQNTDNNVVNPLSGYEFKKDGTLIPLNINTLDRGNWTIKNNTLLLSLKSSQNQSVDTVGYKVSISKDELILSALNSNENAQETYLRIR